MSPAGRAAPAGPPGSDAVLNNSSGVESSLRVSRCKQVVEGLPETNGIVLKFLLGFLHRVGPGWFWRVQFRVLDLPLLSHSAPCCLPRSLRRSSSTR